MKRKQNIVANRACVGREASMSRAMSGILTMAVLGVLTGRTCAFAGVVRAPLGLVKNMVRGRASVQRGAGVRALLCPCSIGRACASGMFTPALLEYMRASRESRDARDIIFHRAVMKMCAGLRKEDACAAASIDTTRRANNALIHAIEDGDALDAAMHAHVKARRVRRKDRGQFDGEHVIR